jgi:hypothetical protein
VYRIPTFEDFYVEEFIPFKTGVLEKMTRIENQVMKIGEKVVNIDTKIGGAMRETRIVAIIMLIHMAIQTLNPYVLPLIGELKKLLKNLIG